MSAFVNEYNTILRMNKSMLNTLKPSMLVPSFDLEFLKLTARSVREASALPA